MVTTVKPQQTQNSDLDGIDNSLHAGLCYGLYDVLQSLTVFLYLTISDPCDSGPCQNNGMCWNTANNVTHNNFTCYCAIKWTGAVCSIGK